MMQQARRPDPVFAEYHAAGSKAGSFMLRAGQEKLIYHVGAPPELFDLRFDPDESTDLANSPDGAARVARLEALLRTICDPEDVDRRAKAEFWGGNDAIRAEGLLVYTPAPGTQAEIERAR